MTTAVPARTSKAALTSFITGILSCVPFVGLLAILTGLVGLFTAGKPGMKGRWMAIVGLLLGLIGTCAWGGFAITGGGIYAIFKATEPVRTATRELVEDLNKGDMVAARSRATSDISDTKLADYAASLKKLGRLKDVTLPQSRIENETGHTAGVATFEQPAGGHQTIGISADLRYEDGRWKVSDLTLQEPGSE